MGEFLKGPDAELDYGFDWTDWLTGSEVIATSTWTIPSGITNDGDSETTTGTKVWLSGGTAGTDYIITNKIVTDSDPTRTEERSHTIKVVNR